MDRKRKKSYLWFWSLFILALVGGIGWCYRSTFISGTIEYAVAQTGMIKHERQIAATFANQELSVLAPFSGKVSYVGKDGQRIKRGEIVATILSEGASPGTTNTSQNKSLTADKGGLFFHQSDGLEAIMTGENLVGMDLNKLLAQTPNPKSEVETAQAGEVIGKIVNNLIPTVAFLKLPSIDDLKDKNSLRLIVGERTVNVKILRKSEDPMGVVVQFPYYVDSSGVQRCQDVTWVYRSPTSGVLIPKTSLWNRGEELGIYLCKSGVIKFKRVKVLDENEDWICVDDEDLNSGVPVVTNPRDGLEGLIGDVKNL